jgi:LysM repeat protein
MFKSVARIALPLLAGGALLALSSCGDDDGGAAVSTVQIKPSSYSVKEAATTTTVAVVPAADPEGRSPAEQTYIVASNQDVPYNIARKFDIPLDELRNYNGWDATYSQFPGTGGTVRIPPGAKFIDPNATTTTAAGQTADTTDSSDSTPAEGTTGDRCHPTYEVQAGDAPLVITRKFDITIEQLNAVNASTPNWPNLYTGRSINLPPPADCAGAVATTTAAPG